MHNYILSRTFRKQYLSIPKLNL